MIDSGLHRAPRSERVGVREPDGNGQQDARTVAGAAGAGGA